MYLLKFHQLIALAVGVFLIPQLAAARDLPTQSSTSTKSKSNTEGSPQSRAFYERGVMFAQQRQFWDAQREFERAVESDPPLDAYFGLGQVELALGRPCRALSAYEKYLDLGGTKIAQDKRQSLEQHVRQLKQGGAAEAVCHPASEAAQLSLRCDTEGVRAQVDDKEVNLSPAEVVSVSPGHHDVQFVSDQMRWAPLRIEVAQGERLTVQCAAALAENRNAPADSGAAAASQSTEPRALNRAAWVTTSTGLAISVAALSHFFYNFGRYEVDRKNGDILVSEPGSPAQTDAYNELGDSIDRASNVTVGLAIAGGVVTAVGISLFIWDGATKPSVPAQKGSAEVPHAWSSLGSSRVSAQVNFQTAALTWSGAW